MNTEWFELLTHFFIKKRLCRYCANLWNVFWVFQQKAGFFLKKTDKQNKQLSSTVVMLALDGVEFIAWMIKRNTGWRQDNSEIDYS